jgi:hypothetical protein
MGQTAHAYSEEGLTRLVENKNGNRKTDCHLSSYVPGTGIEPAHPCERQILSLLRLPIPPPGL